MQKNTRRLFLTVNKQPAATTYSTAEKIRIYTAIEIGFVTPEMCSKIPFSIQKEGIRTRTQNQYHTDKVLPGKILSSLQ